MSTRVIDIRRYQRDWRARDPQPLEPMEWPEPPQASVMRNAAMLLAALAGGDAVGAGVVAMTYQKARIVDAPKRERYLIGTVLWVRAEPPQERLTKGWPDGLGVRKERVYITDIPVPEGTLTDMPFMTVTADFVELEPEFKESAS